MPNPFDGNDGSWPTSWPQYSSPYLPYSSGFAPSSYYDYGAMRTPAMQAAYDFWFGGAKGVGGANATPDALTASSAAANTASSAPATSSLRVPSLPTWADPNLNESSTNSLPSGFGSSSASNWYSLGLTPPFLPDPNNPYSLPPPQRLPYSAAAGGMWEGLAKRLEQTERANGLPTDGFLGSFAYLPTSSDATSPNSQGLSSLSRPPDLPLSVSTLSNNFAPNGLPRFTGGPPDYLSAPPAAAQSDPTNLAPANQSILFQYPPSSFDSSRNGPDNRKFGPDIRKLAGPGLPLSKSGGPYFPPPIRIPSPDASAIGRWAAQLVAPFTYGTLTYEPPPILAANADRRLPSAPALPSAAAFDAAMLLLPEARVARGAWVGVSLLERAALDTGASAIRPAADVEALTRAGLLNGAQPYGWLSGRLLPGWQAHHLNQTAVYREELSRNQALAYPVYGNAFAGPGTQHFNIHGWLERRFWDEHRPESNILQSWPKNADYGEAGRLSLLAGGVPPGMAATLREQATAERLTNNLSESARVPRIPGIINQRR